LLIRSTAYGGERLRAYEEKERKGNIKKEERGMQTRLYKDIKNFRKS
jgi:hypothetical protein